jgi:hypothetical protein
MLLFLRCYYFSGRFARGIALDIFSTARCYSASITCQKPLHRAQERDEALVADRHDSLIKRALQCRQAAADPMLHPDHDGALACLRRRCRFRITADPPKPISAPRRRGKGPKPRLSRLQAITKHLILFGNDVFNFCNYSCKLLLYLHSILSN